MTTPAPPQIIDLFDALKRSLEKRPTGDPMPAKPEAAAPTTTKKTRSPAARAATAYNRIEELRHARDVEISNAPDSINARYETKIGSVRSGLADDSEVLELLDRMLGNP